jgi:hypothetical protein
MNRHTKLAVFIMPFLAILGYVASDYYIEHQASAHRTYQLQPKGNCDALKQSAESCVLVAGTFAVNVKDTAGTTEINATFPLDSATLFVENDKGLFVEYSFSKKQADNAYYWQSKTHLRQQSLSDKKSHTLRIIAQIKGGQYISEFISVSP